MKEILDNKKDNMVGTLENGIDILQGMTALTLEHSYDNKRGFDDGTVMHPPFLSPNYNVEASEASAVDTISVCCSESSDEMGTTFGSLSL